MKNLESPKKHPWNSTTQRTFSQHALRHSSRPEVIASAFVRFSEEGAGDHRGGAVGWLGFCWKLDMVEKGLEIWSWFLVGCFRNWVRNDSFLRDGISFSGFNILEKKAHTKIKKLCVCLLGSEFLAFWVCEVFKPPQVKRTPLRLGFGFLLEVRKKMCLFPVQAVPQCQFCGWLSADG